MQCGFWQPRVHVQDDGSALGRPLGFPELCGNFLRSSRRSALDSFVAVLPLPPAVNEPPLLLLKGDTASTEGGGRAEPEPEAEIRTEAEEEDEDEDGSEDDKDDEDFDEEADDVAAASAEEEEEEEEEEDEEDDDEDDDDEAKDDAGKTSASHAERSTVSGEILTMNTNSLSAAPAASCTFKIRRSPSWIRVDLPLVSWSEVPSPFLWMNTPFVEWWSVTKSPRAPSSNRRFIMS